MLPLKLAAAFFILNSTTPTENLASVDEVDSSTSEVRVPETLPAVGSSVPGSSDDGGLLGTFPSEYDQGLDWAKGQEDSTDPDDNDYQNLSEYGNWSKVDASTPKSTPLLLPMLVLCSRFSPQFPPTNLQNEPFSPLLHVIRSDLVKTSQSNYELSSDHSMRSKYRTLPDSISTLVPLVKREANREKQEVRPKNMSWVHPYQHTNAHSYPLKEE